MPQDFFEAIDAHTDSCTGLVLAIGGRAGVVRCEPAVVLLQQRLRVGGVESAKVRQHGGWNAVVHDLALEARVDRTVLQVVVDRVNEVGDVRAEIEELVASKRSLMPEGLEKDIPAQDLANVLAFVQSQDSQRVLETGGIPVRSDGTPVRGGWFVGAAYTGAAVRGRQNPGEVAASRWIRAGIA